MIQDKLRFQHNSIRRDKEKFFPNWNKVYSIGAPMSCLKIRLPIAKKQFFIKKETECFRLCCVNFFFFQLVQMSSILMILKIQLDSCFSFERFMWNSSIKCTEIDSSFAIVGNKFWTIQNCLKLKQNQLLLWKLSIWEYIIWRIL